MSPQLEMLKGTLHLMVLQTLESMGALHGYGVARRIEQISGDAILLNQGTTYASLVRLQQRGLIRSEWGTSLDGSAWLRHHANQSHRRTLHARKVWVAVDSKPRGLKTADTAADGHGGLRGYRIFLPRPERTSSTPSSAVRLCSSMTGLISTISMETMASLSAIISMAR